MVSRHLIAASGMLAYLLSPSMGSAANNTQELKCAYFIVSADEGRISNSCDAAIIVTWRDDGPCHIRCRAHLKRSERQAIAKPQGDYSWDFCTVETGRSSCRAGLRSASSR